LTSHNDPHCNYGTWRNEWPNAVDYSHWIQWFYKTVTMRVWLQKPWRWRSL